MKFISIRKNAGYKSFIRTGMGTKWQKNRDVYEWFDYDLLLTGQDPNYERWSEIVQSEPSVGELFAKITRYKDKKKQEIARYYGLKNEDLEKMYKTFIGYDVNYGLYAVHIGPYESKDVQERALYHFLPFAQRYRKASQKEILATVVRHIGNIRKNFDIADLDTTDFGYVSQFKKEDAHGYNDIKSVDSIDPNNPNVMETLNDMPYETRGKVVLNAKGCLKILKGAMGPWFQSAVEESGQSEEEFVRQFFEDTDGKKMKKFYNRVYKLWADAKEAGDPIASVIKMPTYDALNRISGQQVPTAAISGGKAEDGQKKVTEKTSVFVQYNLLKKEILQKRTMITDEQRQQREESEILADMLNNDPRRVEITKKRQVNQRTFQKKIDRIESKIQELDRALEQGHIAQDYYETERIELYKELSIFQEKLQNSEPVYFTPEDVIEIIGDIPTEDLENPERGIEKYDAMVNYFQHNFGCKDLKQAIRMAQIYFSKSRDGKILDMPEIISPATVPVNYTVDFLRQAKERSDAIEAELPEEEIPPYPTQPEVDEGELIFGEQPVVEDILPEDAVEEEPIDDMLLPPDIQQERQRQPEDVEPQKEEEVEEKDEAAEADEDQIKEIEDLLSSTLKNLIKISRDLDENKKYAESEEIHKIIRKYQGRM